MLRLIHTADWHLGHSLHGMSREWEHRSFLGWLADTLASERTDALIVAGDIFDSANPPATAQETLFSFLATCRQSLPGLDVVIVAGNHDSPARLEAPAPILEALGIRVVGGLPRHPDGSIDCERLLVPLTDSAGEVGAVCAALPYLRPQDLPPSAAEDPLVDGVTQLYAQVFEAIATAAPGLAKVATSHCYMTGGQLSELSERKILGGNLHALPASIFPNHLDYVALGHLHLAQAVAGRATWRYSGAPLPLSLAEGGYPHQVVRVDLNGPGSTTVEAIPVPRFVELLRVPESGPRPLPEVLELLTSLEVSGEKRPFLEVRVLLEQPEPALRTIVAEALGDAPVRLVRISPFYAEGASPLAETRPEIDLAELTPHEVFLRRYAQLYADEPPKELDEAFNRLLESVDQEPP